MTQQPPTSPVDLGHSTGASAMRPLSAGERRHVAAGSVGGIGGSGSPAPHSVGGIGGTGAPTSIGGSGRR